MSDLEDRTFLWLVLAVSVAFVWILWPFSGAVLWAIIGAILFTPLYRRVLRALRQRRTLAALATVIIVIVMVILPLGLIAAMLVQEASGVSRESSPATSTSPAISGRSSPRSLSGSDGFSTASR